MSGKKNYTRTEPGERIDHPDFDHTAVRSQLDADIQVPSEIILGGDASPRSAVVSGWSVSQPFGAPSIIEITPGVLLAGLRDAGEVKYGLIVANTEPKQISIDNIGNGSWGLWIRFDFVDAEVSNRIFWDAVLPTPTEVPRNIPTRRAQGWSEKIELQSQPDPGPEYVKIAEFTTAGGIVTASSLVGVRDFLFEGREDLVASWGDTDDRSDDRATYGIQGLKRYAHAVNQQLQEIIGAALNQSASPNGNSEVAAAGGSTARWYRKAVKSLSQMLSLDGSRHMEGDLLPDDTANLRDLGNNADNRWGVFYGTNVDATDDVSAGDQVTAGTNVIADVDKTWDAGDPFSLTKGGNFKFGDTRTWYRSIPITAGSGLDIWRADSGQLLYFDVPTSAYADPNGGGAFRTALIPTTGGTGRKEVYWPIDLPSGVTITGFSALARVNNVTDITFARLSLLRINHAAGTQVRVELFPGGTPLNLVASGVSTDYRLFVDSSISLFVNNQAYSYQLVLNYQNSVAIAAQGSDFAIMMLRIEYSDDTLNP